MPVCRLRLILKVETHLHLPRGGGSTRRVWTEEELFVKGWLPDKLLQLIEANYVSPLPLLSSYLTVRSEFVPYFLSLSS